MHLVVEYPLVPIIVIVDNYSSHTTHVVADWLAQNERVRVLYLPKYCKAT